ncbi:Protein JASON [Linum perenne]
MICASSLKREFYFICRSLVGFLYLCVFTAMSCFFDCFRGRDGRQGSRRHPQLVSPARTPAVRSSSVSLSSVLFASFNLETEKSPATSKGNLSWASPKTQKELRDEARFLKACGTLPETPAEFRQASQKLKSSPPADDGSENSNHHSWLPNSSAKKLLAEMRTDDPFTPMKNVEELGRRSISSDQAPSSCISYAQNSGRVSMQSTEDSEGTNYGTVSKVHEDETNDASSASPFVAVNNTQLRNKSVHFQCDFETSSSKGSSTGTGDDAMKNSDRFGDLSVTKSSIRPTPLKLSSEMQTPGTVFSTNLETLGNGKARVRSQYVCSVLQPVENASQWQELKEEDHENSTPNREAAVEGTSPSKDSKVEASLSAWLKPVSQTNRYSGNLDPGTGLSKKFNTSKTAGDRPIIGMVAAHWTEDQPTEISPKWWDGNGIPNSTNKYKEDQKVSWHATPFEERLEKALSEETSISQIKPVSSSPISFDEGEESDTAFSKLPSATSHSKSVVSY